MYSNQTLSFVRQFFADKAATKAQCDEYVKERFGKFGEPAKIQGAHSYTVIITSSNQVVQFRSDKIDMGTWWQARLIYGNLVPDCFDAQCKIKDLSIYISEKVDGTAYMGMANRHGNTNVVVGLAKFFALSWKNNMRSSINIDFIRTEFLDKLTTLSTVLPDTSENLQHVLRQLESLFTATYPQVLTHEDLNEMNIMVNSDGNITGIVDWVDARVLPFGISLYGLENLLGYMDNEGWQYSQNHVELRTLFWDVFKNEVGEISDAEMKGIMVARMAGLFMRYGFTWDGTKMVANADGSYLRVFCLIEDAK